MNQAAKQAPLGQKKQHPFIASLHNQRELWLICIPIIIWAGIFCYYPLYGLLMAFVDYVPGKEIWQCNFVGLKHFIGFVTKPIFFNLLRNTLAMSLLNITIGFIFPILFAFLINELGNSTVKKVTQTMSYLPYFVSWVVVGSIVTTMLSNEGILNKMLMTFGLIDKPVPFLTKGENYWGMITIVNIWKNLGWQSIIYLSAMTGVDEEIYQAGAIDGLNRMGMAIHITLPTILPTIVLLWILAVGGILNAGFDQHLIIGNTTTQQYWEVIDTYAYRYGIQKGFYSVGTAVSLMKSLVGFALVVTTNAISRKVSDIALF